MAVYSHAHLIGWLRRMSRGAVYQARYWRQEADAPLSYTTPRPVRHEGALRPDHARGVVIVEKRSGMLSGDAD